MMDCVVVTVQNETLQNCKMSDAVLLFFLYHVKHVSPCWNTKIKMFPVSTSVAIYSLFFFLLLKSFLFVGESSGYSFMPVPLCEC